MRKILLSLASCLSVFALQAQDVTVTVDVQANNTEISPYIYGANNHSASATAVRWGGNRTTTFNWENNYSNAGEDYLQQSDTYFLNGINSADKGIPAIPVLNFVNTAESKKQYSMITLQAAGYVAADAAGIVSEEEKAPSARWNEIVFRKGSAFSLTPDLTDGKVYTDEFVNYLIQTLGSAGNGGPDAYSIDNEPVLWNSTHKLSRPNDLSFDEIFEKTYAVASVVKDLDPNADVYGPVFYGWQGMERLHSYSQFKPIRDANGYDFYMDYYLDSLRKIEEVEGRRLVDVLDLHWYPEAKSKGSGYRIVDLFGQFTEEDMVTDEMVVERLQAPRSLWDDTYVENSFISVQYGKINLINRMKKSIDTYYPGTKIAFTEFKYGAEYHFSGGLAIADVLGVFGREGVYMASKWDPINSYTTSAYDLYTNYDGNGSTYGNVAVQALVDNNFKSSTFASTDEDGNLHLIVINKESTDQETAFNVSGGYYSNGVVYGFGKNSLNIVAHNSVDEIIDGAFTYTVPAYTALHFILSPIARTEIVSAKVIEGNANQIQLTFSSDISLDETQALTEISATVGLLDASITALAIGNSNQLIVTLATPITGADSVISISYMGIGIKDATTLIAVAKIQDYTLTNELLAAPAYLQYAKSDVYGKSIELRFSKPLEESTTTSAGLIVTVDNASVAISSVEYNSEMPYTLVVFPENRILKYSTIKVVNTAGILTATDATVVSNFDQLVINNGPNYSPVVDSVILKDNYSLSVYFNKDVQINNMLETGFVFKENGTPIDASFTLFSNELLVSTVTTMLQENTYTMDYVDNAYVQTLHGGYLNAISNYAIVNNLLVTPAAVNIPARIEAEDFSYIKGTIQFETTSDVDGDEHIGFIGKDYLFAYHINNTTAGTYTINLRHAGNGNGMVEIWVNGVKKTDIYMPSTNGWTTWTNSAAAIELETGEQFVEVRVIKNGFNLNWVSIENGSVPSIAQIESAFTSTDGKSIYVFYNRQLESLPNASDITVNVDGEKIPLKTVEFFNEDPIKLLFTTDSIIMKGQDVTISYANLNVLTTQGGMIEDAVSTVITNKSKVANTLVEVASSELIKVYPVPAQVSQFITLSSQVATELHYSLINANGAVIEQGVCNGEASLSVNAAGVYTLRVQGVHKTTSVIIIVK